MSDKKQNSEFKNVWNMYQSLCKLNIWYQKYEIQLRICLPRCGLV